MANAMPTRNNVRYTPPARMEGRAGHYGLTLGLPGFALGPSGFALGFPGFLDTNMLVFFIFFLFSNRKHSKPRLYFAGLPEYQPYR